MAGAWRRDPGAVTLGYPTCGNSSRRRVNDGGAGLPLRCENAGSADVVLASASG